jgi:hypothetical protein
MVPTFEYQPARRFKVQTLRSVTPVKLGRLLEQQPDWVWTAVEQTNPALPFPELLRVSQS